MNKLLSGFVYGFIAQILTFLQLQGNIKYNWYQKYPWIILGVSVPISWLYIKSVEAFVHHFNGEIWPSRLIGFGVGIIVFVLLSWILFKEPLTLKTIVSVTLAAGILAVQILWK